MRGHRGVRHPPSEATGFIVRRNISLVRLVAFTAFTCAAVWIGWRAVADTAAYDLAKSSPEEALEWSSRQSKALNQIALNELRKPDGDIQLARNMAERALRVDPLSEEALLALGLIAEKSHNAREAALLARMAGARTWRDPATQIWLFERAVRAGNFAGGLEHADAIFRVNPQ